MHQKKLLDLIRKIPDYPKPGILFYDITTLLQDATGFRLMVDVLADKLSSRKIDDIAAIDARGFIVGAALAHHMHKGLVLVRKKGKLPHKVVTAAYALEYGEDAVEVHVDAIGKGRNILVVDDLLATGGTASAACRLITELGGVVDSCAFIIELEGLGGRKRLSAASNVVSLLNVAG